ncbi:MAG TPA: alpha/beta hydrolase [Candidatus Nanoarchaeia archaeon]|nr:alpha/beta hydrolase [Candidatus Nanoarchaeia archaeon]
MFIKKLHIFILIISLILILSTQNISAKEREIPLVLLHGFDSSPSALKEFQNRLKVDKFYTIGQDISPDNVDSFKSSCKAKWNKSSSFTVTYYKSQESNDISIRIYAQRLKTLIDTITTCTNSNKVDIVAHSMGGLVTREMIRSYGFDQLNKIMLLGTPNDGVYRGYSALADVCQKQECKDMIHGSTFLETLNENSQGIGLYTVGSDNYDLKYQLPFAIVGEQDYFRYERNPGKVKGDGIVRLESVRVDKATNIILTKEEGQSCGHMELIVPKKCPQAYQQVVSSLGVYQEEKKINVPNKKSLQTSDNYDFPLLKKNNQDIINNCNNNKICTDIIKSYKSIGFKTESKQITIIIENGQIKAINEGIGKSVDFTISLPDQKLLEIYDLAKNNNLVKAVWAMKGAIPLSIFLKLMAKFIL